MLESYADKISGNHVLRTRDQAAYQVVRAGNAMPDQYVELEAERARLPVTSVPI